MENVSINEKRKKHYSEYLDSIVNSTIPDGLFEKVKEYIDNNMNYQGIVSETLYQLKLQKYYEYIPYLNYKLKTGKNIEFPDKNTLEEIKRIFGIFVDNFSKIYTDVSLSIHFYLTCKILEKMDITNEYFNIKRISKEKIILYDKMWDKVSLNNS
jgi:hypothetical protein